MCHTASDADRGRVSDVSKMKLLVLIGVLAAAAGACVPPPGLTFWQVLNEDGSGPARAGGQVGETPPSTVTLTTVGTSLGLDQQVCVGVTVLDAPPPYDMAVTGADALHFEQDCVTAPALVPGENVVTISGLLSEWDDSVQGELEGRWLLIDVTQFFEPNVIYAPQQLRSVAFDGSAPMSLYCGGQVVTPCPTA